MQPVDGSIKFGENSFLMKDGDDDDDFSLMFFVYFYVSFV